MLRRPGRSEHRASSMYKLRIRSTAGFVSVTTGAGNRVVIKANESRKIAGKTILLDSVKLGPDGRIWIHFVVDGKLKTVYYSP